MYKTIAYSLLNISYQDWLKHKTVKWMSHGSQETLVMHIHIAYIITFSMSSAYIYTCTNTFTHHDTCMSICRHTHKWTLTVHNFIPRFNNTYKLQNSKMFCHNTDMASRFHFSWCRSHHSTGIKSLRNQK